MAQNQSGLPFTPYEFSIPGEQQSLKVMAPADPDAVLGAITEDQFGKDKYSPYWAEHWPSAHVLLPFLSRQTFPQNTQICELGSGLGVISSLLAQKLLSTIATDISPAACVFARTNIIRNNGTARVVCCDWRSLPFKRTFNLIIASDILYEEGWVEPILTSIKALLKTGGKAWIADPCRTWWDLFKQRSAFYGFSSAVLSRGPGPRKSTIEILELKLMN